MELLSAPAQPAGLLPARVPMQRPTTAYEPQSDSRRRKLANALRWFLHDYDSPAPVYQPIMCDLSHTDIWLNCQPDPKTETEVVIEVPVTLKTTDKRIVYTYKKFQHKVYPTKQEMEDERVAAFFNKVDELQTAREEASYGR